MSIKITIGRKLSFAFLIILLLMALTLGITIKSYNSVIKNLEATNEDASMQGAAGNVRFSIAQLIMFANDYIITEKDYYRQMFEQQRARVESYRKKLHEFELSSNELVIVNSIAADVDSIYAYAHRIFAISKPRLSSEAATLMETMDHKFGDAVSRKTTEIFDIVFSRIEELRIQSARSKEQMLHTIYTVFFLALLVSLVFVYLSVQRIVKPIKTVVKAADAIAKGDYTQRPLVTTHDEVASLARSFSKMAEAIEKSYQELEARKRFKENIYAAVPSGLLVFDEEAKVLSVNRSFCDLFNLQYQQTVGQSVDDVLQLIGISQKCKDAIVARMPFRNLECTCHAAAKGEMTLNLTLSGIRNAAEEEKEVLLVIEDITERRIAEEMIKKSEDLIRTTLYSIGDAVITTDKQGIVQRLNPVAEHLTGWKESDAQGKPIEYIFNIINEETYNKVENPVKKVLREGVVVGLANHTLLISKYGIEAPIADSGAPIKNETGEIIGVVLVFRDQTEEREKQKALEHSNARLKEAQRMAHIGNWELDLQKNELYWCDEIFRIFEIDPAEFGASYEAFLNLVHPEEREFVNNAYTNSVKNKTPYSIDHRLLMKNGRIKFVHVQCETYYDDQGHTIRSVGTVQDITERKIAEEALRKSEMLLSKAQEIAHLGNWDWDIITNEQRWSDEVYRLLGRERQHLQVVPGVYADFIHPEDREWVLKSESEALFERKPYNIECRIVRPDGQVRIVHEQAEVSFDPEGKPTRMFGTVQDITERKRDEKELAEREKRYRTLFNLSPSGIVLEDVEGNIVEVNEASCKSLGYSPEELVGKNVRMVASPEEIPHIEDHIALLRSGKTLQHVVENVRKDGTRCWMELYETLILLPDGREGFLIVTHDITDRKRAEEEIRLLLTLTQTIAEAEDFNSALAAALRMVSESTSWDFGEIWIPSSDSRYLELSPSWYCRVQNVESFRTASERFTFAPGVGLPGRVWASKKPAWIPDVTVDANFPRATFAKEVGFKAAVGIPIIVGKHVMAVMEFFLREVRQEDERMVALVSTVAVELGTLFQRKQAEESLKESEEKYRIVADWTYAWEYWIGADENIVYMSPSVEKITGYKVEKFVNDPTLLYKIIFADDLEIWNKHKNDKHNLKNSNEHLEIEFRIVTKNGDIRWIEHICRKIFNNEGKYIGLRASNRDITENKTALNEIRKLFTAIKQSPLSTIITDINGKMEYVNPKCIEVTGYKKEELIGCTPRIFRAGLTTKEKYKEMWETIKSGEVWKGELLNKRKNGDMFWEAVIISPIINSEGEMTNYLAVREDITERKKLEQELKEYREHLEDIVKKRTTELRQSEERFRALAENSEDTIMRFNRKLQHLYVNPVVEKQTGIKAEEFIGKTHKDLGFPEDLVLLWEPALENVFENKGKNRIEFELPNGIWIDWIIIPEFDEDGKVNTVVTSGRDITELKEYEEKINEALQKEKELHQLKSKFISAASHQFRTPLASILSSAQMIKRYANKWNEEKLNEHHERIHESIKNLTQLMDEVLLIGKSEEGKDSLKPEEADIEELFNKFIEEVKPLLNEKQEINYKNRAGKKYMKLDKKALHQIMNNLLSNAVKYTPEGGKIKIETDLEDGKLKIIVEDEGIGIPKEEIKYIFDSFYRTANAVNFPGTGLGLNIVKRIVDLYKGTIDVACGLSKGTKFTVKLPISAVNE